MRAGALGFGGLSLFLLRFGSIQRGRLIITKDVTPQRPTPNWSTPLRIELLLCWRPNRRARCPKLQALLNGSAGNAGRIPSHDLHMLFDPLHHLARPGSP
jgi:hypothetical protein